MFEPAPIRFVYRPWPVESFFYEMDVFFGDRREELGGSNVFIGPEIELMRAAVALLAGGRSMAVAHFPAENDQYDLVLLAVTHDDYVAMGADKLSALIAPGGLFADLKNAVPGAGAATGRWTL